MKRVAIIEDRSSFGLALRRRLDDLGMASISIPHSESLDLRKAVWSEIDFVLLDALDIGIQQSDPSLSRLVSLDVLDRIPTGGPEVVVYSTAMAQPEVNIPLRGQRRASAFYDAFALFDHLEAISRREFSGQVDEPTINDWARLDPRLPVGVDVASAHQRIRTHERSWEQVWRERAPFDKAAQMWISRNVLPILGNPEGGGYAMAVSVVRRIAGLPFTLA
jgi:hypothetical protein